MQTFVGRAVWNGPALPNRSTLCSVLFHSAHRRQLRQVHGLTVLRISVAHSVTVTTQDDAYMMKSA